MSDQDQQTVVCIQCQACGWPIPVDRIDKHIALCPVLRFGLGATLIARQLLRGAAA